ncbi:MAG: hypothetical protein CBD03_05780 [Rhizobiales bacterium TMED143]|nr:4-hydroxyacetophenone monooxygenase [Rhodobiaceae bacterium]MBL6787225.1 NAD(P)/FAD-dependent oxidoreductase [PS1 clade bacterium]OUV90237.1 MAG: hypothetical protein CBD03_05780 [Rhizobiales bacterium TMED143]HCQ82334.1 4-hydroxyacetophenone monooxygenase [Rhodobiaceae bacterium]|tara:strand:- start:743 stop:2215 length:1473 start_codon:yes stop_codon:yes gene_type:complete
MKSDIKIAVLGAGMSGMAMGQSLNKAGFSNFTIYEKAERVGGTWRENDYPGVACDVPSHLYSFSFERNPNWSEAFSPGGEIQQYCEETAKKYGLLPHCAFNRTVTHASYENGTWRIDFADGQTEFADVVVSAMGGLHVPQTPEFAGKRKFKGPQFHTAHWDHNVDLTNKRVAIVGSAASAVQVIPQIIDKVAHLDVYQRTPNWVLPRMNKKYPGWRKWLHRNVPFTSLFVRGLLYLRSELLLFPAFVAGSFMQRRLRKTALQHLEDNVSDLELRAKLTPDFQVGCKRILMIDGYFEALQRGHAELVTSGISKITDTGIVTEDGDEHPADIIIYATGFKPFDFLTNFSVTGLGGRDLADSWAQGVTSHRSVAVAGFPNFFMLLGPNSGLGHNSVIIMIEAQVNYVTELVKRLAKRGLGFVDPKPDAQEAFTEEVHSGLEGKVWTSGCQSWYQSNTGFNHTLWPYSTMRFIREMKKPDLSEFNHGANRDAAE